MSLNEDFPWLRAAGLTANNLSDDEANELDTLIFRKNCDLPFGDADQDRIDELREITERTQ